MPTTINMNMILPDVSVTPGPEWASELNEALQVVDTHDHSDGFGKKVTPAGIDINMSLDVNEQSLLNVQKVSLVNQDDPLNGVENACSVSFSDGNFYITNSGGVAVQVTDGNQVKSTTVIPSSPLMPAGTVLDYAGITVPPGFLMCDGTAISRVTYSDLFTAIGTAWGIGDGSTTFNLPNAAGRAGVGSGTYADTVDGSVTRSLGQTLGTASHVLTTNEMPSHTHTQNPHSHALIQRGIQVIDVGSDLFPYATGGGLNTTETTATNNTTGGGLKHNNMQPSFVVNKIIKY